MNMTCDIDIILPDERKDSILEISFCLQPVRPFIDLPVFIDKGKIWIRKYLHQRTLQSCCNSEGGSHGNTKRLMVYVIARFRFNKIILKD